MNFFTFFIFAIHSSSRHEKCCQMSLRLVSLFRGSIYQQWVHIMFYNHKLVFFLLSVDCDALHHWLDFRGVFLYRVRIEKGSETDFLDHSNLHQFVAKSHLPSAQCGLHIVTSCNIGYRHRKVSTFFGLFWRWSHSYFTRLKPKRNGLSNFAF